MGLFRLQPHVDRVSADSADEAAFLPSLRLLESTTS